MSDHVHVLFGMRPAQSLSDLLQVIKANSSKWINERGFVKGRFEWQQGLVLFHTLSRKSPMLFHISKTGDPSSKAHVPG